MRQARQVRALLAETTGKQDALLRAQLDQVQPLLGRVIEQAERRVLQEEGIPATEKILSPFEPETALIRRGKARQPTEFSANVVLDEMGVGW
jgi:IS5 family transposase